MSSPFNRYPQHLRLWLTGPTVLMAIVLAWAAAPDTATARDYYIDAAMGSDTASGSTPDAAWRSLAPTHDLRLGPGDHLLLKRGGRFQGSLAVTGDGKEGLPAVIGAYGPGTVRPVIDAAGQPAGIWLRNSRHVVVQAIEISGDSAKAPAAMHTTHIAGVLVDNQAGYAGGDLTLRDLHIHDIFATIGQPDEGAGRTTSQGYGIEILNSGRTATLAGIRITDCTIERTGRTGIDLKGGAIEVPASYIDRIEILNNQLTDIGGPGINPHICRHVVVAGNTVNRSGSSADPRMHRRGSGIWPWHCNAVLIEHNRFMHARGPGDSCGIHIDFGCRDVVVQYNLSLDNEGGFVEILGDNFNCAYRYNISVNDGSRTKGRNGAFQEGKILWFSGYVGRRKPRQGPTDCYIYNNTVYVAPGSRSCFAVGSTTRGVLIANNLFVLLGRTLDVSGDQEKGRHDAITSIPDAIVTHNLYVNRDVLPPRWPLRDDAPIYGDPALAHPGGSDPQDYVPGNAGLVRDRGVVITPLPGDKRGLRGGLAVPRDILGHPITGRPDLGAIELPAPLPSQSS